MTRGHVAGCGKARLGHRSVTICPSALRIRALCRYGNALSTRGILGRRDCGLAMLICQSLGRTSSFESLLLGQHGRFAGNDYAARDMEPEQRNNGGDQRAQRKGYRLSKRRHRAEERHAKGRWRLAPLRANVMANDYDGGVEGTTGTGRRSRMLSTFSMVVVSCQLSVVPVATGWGRAGGCG